MAKKNNDPLQYKHKRCPECFAILKLDAVQCLECKTKVGKVDPSTGIAKRLFNWKAYLAFIVALAAFVGYIWKMFYK